MDRTVLLTDEVSVVGRDDLDAVLLSKAEDFVAVAALLLVEFVRLAGDLGLVLHHLEVVVVPKDLLVPGDHFINFLLIPGEDGAGHFAGDAGGRADEALVILLDDLVADPRAVIHPVDMGLRNNLDKV